MSKIDENQIRERLKMLSQIEPAQESADNVVQRVRDTVMNEEQRHERTTARIFKAVFRSHIAKLSAAAVLLIGLGYLSGRLSGPQPLDVEELRATLESSLKSSLESAIRQELLKEIDSRWQSTFAANCAELKDELQQQVRRDLTEFAAQTLAASGTMTQRRLTELIQLIEAARMQDRRRIEEAFEQIEWNRLQDRTRFGNSLVTLAARTNELLGSEQN